MTEIFDFVGGGSGQWKVLSIKPVIGETLEVIPYLNINFGSQEKLNEGSWSLKGFRSNLRYTEKAEKEKLLSMQAELGGPDAICAALIPIRKTQEWWALAQDERRKIFEADSKHTEIGMKYLPAIARKLYHCRDYNEPFDFLTWFEYAPAHLDVFEELVLALRKTREWHFVEREVDIRLEKA
jgi:chlorite dismutase